MLYDTFHLQWEGYDPLAVLQEYTDVIGHVHLSDANREGPACRPLPGFGEVDFGPLVEFLQTQPHLRFWTLEGSPATPASLEQSVAYLRGI
jgi:sugar phosphate isomerase/epimerase